MPYKVMTMTTVFDRMNNTVQSYIVSDRPDKWNDDKQGKWPPVAEFYVSQRNTDEEQQRRAFEYRDYMNSKVVIHPPIGT